MRGKIILVVFLIVILNSYIISSLKMRPVKRKIISMTPKSVTKATNRTGQKLRWKILLNDGNGTISQESVEVFNEIDKTTLLAVLPVSPVTWAPDDPKVDSKPKIGQNYANVKEGCDRFMNTTTKFDLNKMADVWQTMFYQLPEKVNCFKVHIKKVTEEEKQQNAKRYGNFNGVVDWNECNLEVEAVKVKAVNKSGRRHFLQGINADLGVMDNIIIEDKNEKAELHEESADQWLVINNILLMRDCDIGGVVVFSKVPFTPTAHDIDNALKVFKVGDVKGKMTCDDEERSNTSFDEDDFD